MQTLTQRIVDLLIAWRIPLLLLGLVAGVVAYFPARGLRLDRSIEKMFAPNDPLLGPYVKLRQTFGGNEIVMAVYVDKDLLHADGRGMDRLVEVGEKLQAVPGVKAVLTLDQPLGHRIVEKHDRLARRVRSAFEGYTHGADDRTAAVVCMLAPEWESDVPRKKTVADLRSVIRQYGGMVTGEPVMVEDGFDYVERDGGVLSWTSTLLLAMTIVLCFRSLRWVLIPVAVVQLTRLLTQAVLVWSGLQLSMVSSMLTAIVTVVGIATVIHILVRFREARAGGLSPRDALSQAGGLLAAPIFWACATTAVGFASLAMAEVEPVRDFGIMMAIGAMMVLVSVPLLVPGLVLLGRFDIDPKRVWGERFLEGELNRLVGWVERRPKTLGLVTILLVGAAVAGSYRLEVETDFTKNFRSGTPIVRSYQFVEKNLGGAGVWDVILPAPEDLDWDYLRRVRRLEDRLRKDVTVPGPDGKDVPGLTKVLSLVDAVVAVAPTDPNRIRLGVMRNALVSTSLKMIAERMPAFTRALHGENREEPGRYYYRIMLRALERQPSAQKQRIIRQVERISREEFQPTDDRGGAEVTGFFVLLAKLVESIIRDQWITFGVATVGIGLMMVVALRSPALALVALVPNALPILVVTGLMGWAGFKINMGAAMIAAVSMGLSIDSSIHYITAFRRARGEGQSIHQAFSAVHQSVGRAVVFSTLALVVGFMALCSSQFVPTIYFGVLVSLSMLGGLAGNLVVLPLLLKLVTRESRNP